MKSLFKAGGVGPQKKLGGRPSWGGRNKAGGVESHYELWSVKLITSWYAENGGIVS